MMYTAINENPCYSGYLWAPFDAFLNVPRLAQFPQNRIWYHSPWGVTMPNVALSSNDKHPPPAMVTNKTVEEYRKEYAEWGQNGWTWWWGCVLLCRNYTGDRLSFGCMFRSPNVGLPVCWPGYDAVRDRFKSRINELTGEHDRFIGGSVDTVYVPGGVRDDFLETLGSFLTTSCFLEIVRTLAPTVEGLLTLSTPTPHRLFPLLCTWPFHLTRTSHS